MLSIQAELPALTKDGKIMLQSTSKIALAPNGNGGVYAGPVGSVGRLFPCAHIRLPSSRQSTRACRVALLFSALHKSKALADMKRRGVEHVHVYGVDNVSE